MPPSGRFQSQVFTFLSRQRLRLQDQVQRLWRRSQIAAVWSAQILLYPVYVAFQTTRLLGTQVSRAAKNLVPTLKTTQPPMELPDADVPIENTLQALWKLLESGAGSQGSGARSQGAKGSGARSQGVKQSEANALVLQTPNAQLQPRTPNPLIPNLQPPIPQSLILPPALKPHGIASLLSDRSLVLTTAAGDLLDILSPVQMRWLQQRMAWELASYWRDRHQFQWAHRPARFLPLPKVSTKALPPVRSFLRLMGWVQQSPVAIATNLFQEATLAQYFHDLDLTLDRIAPGQLNGRDAFKSLSGTPTIPVQPSMFDPDDFSHSTQTYEWFVELTEQTSSNSASTEDQPVRSTAEIFTQTAPTATGQTNSRNTADVSADVSAVSSKIARAKTTPIAAKPIAAEITPLVEAQATTTLQTATAAATTARPSNSTTVETQASLVGYVKHPLEQLLEWLDHGMVWIEENWLLFWHWLTRPRGR